MDAGDWVAVGAVLAALIGLIFARRSARAAQLSLGIAREAADAASASARAAERSADADSRSADIAEANFHKERGPKWDISIDAPGTGGCVVKLRFDDGPNEVRVVVVVSGTAWARPVSGLGSEGFDVFLHNEHPLLHPGQSWDLFWKMPDGVDVDWVETIVSVLAVDLDERDDKKPLQPWQITRGVDSPMKARPRYREIG